MDFIVSNWQSVLTIVIDVIALVCFIITFVRTGNIKKCISDFEEVFKLKYKTVNSSRKKYTQTFTPEVEQYVLNPANNELEVLPVKKNIDDYIQSHIETCLERALERFLPKVQDDDNVVADYTSRVDDLASLGEAMEIAEGYREQFGLSDKASIADIYAAVDKSAKDLKAKLQSKPVEQPKSAGSDNNA